MAGGECVLVTGGTGFIGRALMRMLVSAEAVEETRLVTRDAQRVRGLGEVSRKVQVREGDIQDSAFVEACLDGVTLVYHLAGLKPDARSVVGDREYVRINTDATLTLAAAALRRGVRRFVYFSSTGVFGHGSGSRLNEDSACAPESSYERTKLASEVGLENLAKGSVMEVVILRPSNVFGEEHPRRHLLTLMRAIRRGLFFLPMPPGWVNFVYVEDVAAGALGLGLSRKGFGRPSRYILNCPRRLEDFACEVARVLGVSDRFSRVPLGPLRVGGRACDVLSTVLHIKLPLTSAKIREMTNPTYFEARRVRAVLQDWPPVGLSAGLQRTAAYYREQGWL